MIDKMIASCQKLPTVSAEIAETYTRSMDRLLDHVVDQLESNPHIKELIGQNPLEVMRNKLRNHALFMSTVFSVNAFELLVHTVSRMYRMYNAKGFSYDYFPLELVSWQIAIHECLHNSDRKSELLRVYSWLVQHHEDFIKLSLLRGDLSFNVKPEADEIQRVFLSLLLHGSTQECITLANNTIQTAHDLKFFYLDVISPAMYRVGQLWESNQVSVADEHVATAIVGRLMAALYPRFALLETTKGKAIVSAGPNEFHELGARMLADFMEMDGWDVTYLGANTSPEKLLETVKSHKPFVINLSVATVFNLDGARQMIQLINEDQKTKDIKIMVGGFAFNGMPDLWKAMGADGYAADAESALRVTDNWWIERNDAHA